MTDATKKMLVLATDLETLIVDAIKNSKSDAVTKLLNETHQSVNEAIYDLIQLASDEDDEERKQQK